MYIIAQLNRPNVVSVDAVDSVSWLPLSLLIS